MSAAGTTPDTTPDTTADTLRDTASDTGPGSGDRTAPSERGGAGPGGGRRLGAWVRARRGTVAVVVLVLAAAVLLALVSGTRATGRLRPDAYGPEGSAALAALLHEQGVAVDVARTPEEAVAAGPGATLLVADPTQLGRTGRAAVAHSGADVVLLRPDAETLGALVPGVGTATPPGGLTAGGTTPACPLRAAVAAGRADLEGDVYTTGPGDVGCFPVLGAPSLVARPPAAPGRAGTVVVGDDEPFTNESLARDGNAALTLGLLGAHPRLVWYLPVPLADEGQGPSLGTLLPSGWFWGALMLAVAVLLAALWRGRRFGPVVTERLPVLVRATETTEGRARLYRRLDARERAARALRTETRRRLAARLGLPRSAPPAAVVRAVADATGRPPGAVAATLDGPPPATDPALVALAADLDALAAAASGTVATNTSAGDTSAGDTSARGGAG